MKELALKMDSYWFANLMRVFDTFLLAIPLWLFWTKAGIGIELFTFLPIVWQSITFIQCWGVLFVIAVVTTIVSNFLCSLWHR